MSKYKCNYCGAPISSRLGICPYCDKSTNLSSKIKSLFRRSDIQPWLIKTKNQINTKLIQPGIILLRNQKIVSDHQVDFVGKYVKKIFIKKRNIAFLVAIPLGLHIYMRVSFYSNFHFLIVQI